jgi:hexosaminidase
MLPREVRFSASRDGVNWEPIERLQHRASDADEEVIVLRFESKRRTKARYLRMEVDGYGPLPASHLGAGNPSWLFMDEWQIDVE